MVYHRILNIMPCAVPWDLIVYRFYIKKLISSSPDLPLHLSPIPHPLATTSLFSMSVSLFLFVSCFRFHI